MGKINQLPTEISDKIAAGEVVERPASVVKELVENSIDAGADVINVEIKKGGIIYIRVTDNGSGMAREDASIAFSRHATSKISKAEDLEAIYTLGFRGEALCSIGAVSKVELLTKRKEDAVGTQVIYTGGKLAAVGDAGIPDGTTFIVNNLFYNTPARMNFLKKDAAEAAAITDIIERFILSHPQISFRYIVDGKEKYFTPGNNDLTGCIYAVYGKNYAKSIIPISYETELVKITGAIGKGDCARANRGYQSFFVNSRYIRSMRISSAVENAYKNQIMIGKHPMAILNIEINPRHIDINVHPTKLEVKFSREEDVLHAIYYAVKNALYAIPNVPKIEHTPVRSAFSRDTATTAKQEEFLPAPIPETAPTPPILTPTHISEPSKLATEEQGKTTTEESLFQEDEPKTETNAFSSYALDASNEYFIKRQQEIVFGNVKPKTMLTQMAKEDNVDEKINELVKTDSAIPQGESMSDVIQASLIDSAASTQKPDTQTLGEEKNPWGFNRDNIRVIGQVFDTYILAQSGDTMIIADQHAAHERLKFEELKKELAKKQVISQALLVSMTVDLTAGEYVAFCENAPRFAEMGFEIEEFGANTLLVRATPEALDPDELRELIVELIGRFSDPGAGVLTEKMERALYTIACKAAVKANHRYSTKELETLLFAVLDLENINTCPHGRPIIITMSKRELEKEFKRIV